MAIVRNIQNNQLYRYLGDNKFRNIVTGKEGLVEDEKAREVFKINVEATGILNEYPLVEDLIEKLKLKIDK
jgi:hypothetical protein